MSTLLVLLFATSTIAADLPKDSLDNTGFVSVFDGKSLAGWHVSAQTGHSGTSGNKSGGKWVIENGAIVGSQDVPGNGGIILTDKLYGDFEVIVEMQNDYGPDSGLFLRSTERGQAYQYMVDYHDNGNLGGIYGEGLSGGIHHRNFDLGPKPTDFVPKEDAFPCPITAAQWALLWKHGEWNELRARIVGNPPQITTWINGVRIMEFKDSEVRHPSKGMIALQVHGGGDFTKQFVRYRGVKVKEIPAVVEKPAAGKQVAQKFTSTFAPSLSLDYLLFLPNEYGKQPETKWPLLLFLHGAGESGDDLPYVKFHGPPKLVERRPGDFPFIVVSPQAPSNHVPYVDRWDARLLAELTDDIAKRYPVDADRLYVTGLSMGGYGTIRLCAHYPEKFAAAVPICGGGSLGYVEPLLRVPMWFIHGDNDLTVPVERSVEIARGMRSGGAKPRMTIYDNVAHDSWTQTYLNPEIYSWLLAHKLSDRPSVPTTQARR